MGYKGRRCLAQSRRARAAGPAFLLQLLHVLASLSSSSVGVGSQASGRAVVAAVGVVEVEVQSREAGGCYLVTAFSRAGRRGGHGWISTMPVRATIPVGGLCNGGRCTIREVVWAAKPIVLKALGSRT